jgi:hypothetical protein
MIDTCIDASLAMTEPPRPGDLGASRSMEGATSSRSPRALVYPQAGPQ